MIDVDKVCATFVFNSFQNNLFTATGEYAYVKVFQASVSQW